MHGLCVAGAARPKVTSNTLQVASYKLQVTSYKLQAQLESLRADIAGSNAVCGRSYGDEHADEEEEGGNMGLRVGIGAGVLLAAAIAALLFCKMRNKARRQQQQPRHIAAVGRANASRPPQPEASSSNPVVVQGVAMGQPVGQPPVAVATPVYPSPA